MKIAITGATGLIGKYLVERLPEHELLLIGRSAKKLRETFHERRKITLCETDYSAQSLLKILKNTGVVVHLAARPARKDFKEFSSYNWLIRISENLFKTCSALGIKNVIFASSKTVYSPLVNHIPYRESEVVYPSTLYGVSKLTVEKIGFFHNLNLKALRFTEIRAFSERSGVMFMTFIQRALKGKPITIYGDGKGVREYLYVKDAVAAIAAAIPATAVRGVFNIGSGVATSNRELAELVREVFSGGRSEIRYDLNKPEALSQYPMDNSRAQKFLNWKPAYSLKKALQEMKDFYDGRAVDFTILS